MFVASHREEDLDSDRSGGPEFEAVDVLPTLTDRAVSFIETKPRVLGQDGHFSSTWRLASPHTPIEPSKAWQGRSG